MIFLMTGCSLTAQKQEAPEYKISSEIYQTYKIPYEKEPRSVEMAVPSAPVRNFVDAWKADHGEDFRTPASYSIPVVSPMEMDRLLTKMKKEEIEDIAKSLYLQNSRFNVKCVGQKEMADHEDIFLVLESEDLARIRLEILEVYRLRGGDRKDFLATDYTPLIPLNETESSREGLTIKGRGDCREIVRAAPPFDGPAPAVNL